MSENTDDLEQTLMLAAAAADSRLYDDNQSQSTPEPSHTSDEVRYYTESSYNESNNDITHQRSCVSSTNLLNKQNSTKPNLGSKRKFEDVVSEIPDQIIKSNYPPLESYKSECVSNKIKSSDLDSYDDGPRKNKSTHAQVVATHYNLIEEKGLDKRSRSRLFYMCNFHNWIKSMLINEYLTKIKESKKQHNAPIRVHDMCCGKGGDLLKWKKGNISHLICSDLAEVSLDHCKQRYIEMKQRSQNERGWNAGNLFTMEVHHGDLGRVRIREKFKDPSMKLDLVSCQFAFHYTFESLSQAECMMKNASECLQPGGYFIGTIPDSNEILARARKSSTGSFKNEVLQVSVAFDLDKPPLFGGKYNFELESLVNCPEFLVHFPTFEKLAKKYGLKLVKKEKFRDFFARMKDEGRQLLNNMRALECFPPNDGDILAGSMSNDYLHAEEFVQKQGKDQIKIGTLSKSEWEVTSLYLTFAFEKVKNTWNADGTPCFNI